MLKLLGSKLRKEMASLQKIQVDEISWLSWQKEKLGLYCFSEAVETWGLELMYDLIGEKIYLPLAYMRQSISHQNIWGREFKDP